MNFDISLALERIRKIYDGFIQQLPNIILALIVFVAFYLTAKLIRTTVRRITEQRGGGHYAGLAIGRLVQGFVVLLGILIALTIALPSFNPADVIQLLGISSVAIGFAFRDILQNFLAGILLLFTQPFRIGDQIVTSNFEGTVEDIQTRATFIKTYDGRRVVIPNGDLFTDKVIVNTAYDKRRVEYDVGIGYGDDIDRAKQLILEALNAVEGISKDPAPDALVMDLAASSVNIRARWWIDPPHRADALDTRDKVLTAIKNRLVENGIDLPFPTQQILFHDQTEETDGDRARQREGWPAGKQAAPESRSIAGAIKETAEAGRSSRPDEPARDMEVRK